MRSLPANQKQRVKSAICRCNGRHKTLCWTDCYITHYVEPLTHCSRIYTVQKLCYKWSYRCATRCLTISCHQQAHRWIYIRKRSLLKYQRFSIKQISSWHSEWQVRSNPAPFNKTSDVAIPFALHSLLTCHNMSGLTQWGFKIITLAKEISLPCLRKMGWNDILVSQNVNKITTFEKNSIWNELNAANVLLIKLDKNDPIRTKWPKSNENIYRWLLSCPK